MIDKATNFLRKFKNKLKEAFGEEAMKHMDESSRGQSNENKQGENMTEEMYTGKDIDMDLQNIILEDTQPDVFARVFLEGMEVLGKTEAHTQGKLENEVEEQNSTQYKGKDTENSGSMNTSRDEGSDSRMSGMSGITTSSKSTANTEVQFYESTKDNERTAEQVRQKEMKKIRITLKEYAIRDDEINAWLEHNVMDPKDERYKWQAKEAIENIKYLDMKKVITDIKK